MARYRIGNDLTILWKVYDREGNALFLNDKEVRLFYTCERGRFEADINIQEDNIVVWDFYGSLQKTLGEYSLTLEIFQSDGMRSIKKDVCGAFVFVGKDCEADVKDTTVSLNGEVVAHQEIIKTNLDVCRVSPVIPYVVRDENGIGYWYVDGVNTGDRSTGESAYEYAVSKGYQGTEEEFASILALVPTDHDSIVKIEDTLPNKADKTGRYPEMSVGFAENLVGRGESVPAEFTFRASGGKSIKDGAARIKRIKGNSVVWNQKIKGFASWNLQGGTIEGNEVVWSASDRTGALNAFSNTFAQHTNHKYLISADVKASSTNVGLGIYFTNSPLVHHSGSGQYERLAVITQGIGDGTDACYLTDTSTSGYGEIRAKNYRCIDLTQMFQAGNEPTTIEEYNARKTIVDDEYAYNEGEVIHCNTESIKSVGDNAWDEEWETGTITTADGIPHESEVMLRSKNYIKVLPSQTYHYLYSGAIKEYALIYFYDDTFRYISYYSNWKINHDFDFTTPPNCCYIKFVEQSAATYKNDIMISLVHSGWKQDTDAGYQPYWQDTLPLPIIRKYFPDGMKSAGSAHDEIRFNKASGKWERTQARFAEIDLGSLMWSMLSETYPRFFVKLNGALSPSDVTLYANILCAKYVNATALQTYHGSVGISLDNQGYLRVYDPTYTDAASFKEAMQGVILYYESNDWEWVELDEPIGTDYRVADFGTEQAISSIPSAPFKADIIYQFNAVDMIRENYNEIEKIKAALAKAGITIDL